MKSEENLLSNTNTKTEAKTFYKSLFKIVAPIAIQNFITCAVNSVDVFMLGLVSQTAIASVSLASRVQFLLAMFFTGLSSGLIMLTAQYWGKKDVETVSKIFCLSLKLSVATSFLFSSTILTSQPKPALPIAPTL